MSVKKVNKDGIPFKPEDNEALSLFGYNDVYGVDQTEKKDN